MLTGLSALSLTGQAATGSVYTVEGYTPPLVFDFERSVFNANGTSSTASSAYTATRTGLATQLNSAGNLVWNAHNLFSFGDSPSSWVLNFATRSGNLFTANAGSSGISGHYIWGSNNSVVPLPANTKVTVRVKVTKGTADYICVAGYHANSVGFAAVVDLTDGTIGDTTGAFYDSATVTQSGDVFIVEVFGAISSANGIEPIISFAGAKTGITFNANFTVNYTASGTETVTLEEIAVYRSDLGGMAPVPLTRRVAGSTTYVPTTSAAVYLPREEAYAYVSGALVGPYYQKESDARTNLITYSEDFTDASWVKGSGAAVLPNTSISPSGSLTAETLTDDAAGGSSSAYLQYAATVITSTSYTFSTYAKQGTQPAILLYVSGFTTPGSGGFFFDLTDGSSSAYAGTSGITASSEDVGNGWYRCSITFTTDVADTTGSIRIYRASGTTTGNEVLDRDGTSSVLIYGAQFEQGSTPSSYIPTSGSTVIRPEDSTTIAAGNMPDYQTPRVIGPELVTNGTFDTDSDWTLGTGVTITGGEAVFTAVATGQNLRQPITLPAGVYLISYDVTEYTTGGVAVFGPAYSPDIQRTAVGSYSEVAYFPGSGNLDIRARGTTTLKVDNISVREINPLALSFQMEGLMTYADTGVAVTSALGSGAVSFVYYAVDDSNGLDIALDTQGGETGEVDFRQRTSGVTDVVRSSTTAYSPGINVPFNIASRHGSTFINGAVDGTALTADLTPTALPDLSATTFELAPTFNGFIKTFRVWAEDIGDSGISEASQ